MNLPGGKIPANFMPPKGGGGSMYDQLRMGAGPNMSPFSNSNVMNSFYAGTLPGVPGNMQGAAGLSGLMGNQSHLNMPMPDSLRSNLSGVQMSQMSQILQCKSSQQEWCAFEPLM